MTPLPKHLEEMRKKYLQIWVDLEDETIFYNQDDFEQSYYDNGGGERENAHLIEIEALNQAASIMLKDMESIVKALQEICWSWDNDAGRQCSNIAEEALKIWREKYSKQSERK